MKRSTILAVAVIALLAGLPLTARATTPSTFTIVALPDTQFYSESYPTIFTSQTQWIVNNQAAQNIAFVAQQGDLVNNDEPYQWANATSAMYLLDGTTPRLPWGTCPGNHDMNQNADAFAESYDANFGPAHFAGQSWYGGACNNSSYQTFDAGGRTYLVMDLQYDAPATMRDWVQGVIDAHPGMPTIVNTHDYLDLDGRTGYGDALWDAFISPNPQIFAVLCGHMHGEFAQTSINAAGKPVFELLADFQDDPNGGDGYLRLYQFDEANSAIHVETYSPYDTSGGAGGTYQTDPSSQFDLSMNFHDRLDVIPEPSTLVLLGLGAISLLGYAWRRARG